MNGGSANIMFGQFSMSGTGLCDLVLDTKSTGIKGKIHQTFSKKINKKIKYFFISKI